MSFIPLVSRIRAMFGAEAIVKSSSEDGQHLVYLRGGVTVSGNTLSRKVTVNWGNGHCAMAVL